MSRDAHPRSRTKRTASILNSRLNFASASLPPAPETPYLGVHATGSRPDRIRSMLQFRSASGLSHFLANSISSETLTTTRIIAAPS